MTDVTHTPGPWEVESGANSHLFDVSIMASSDCVAFCDPEDAPLIRSAPELLEALEEAVALLEQLGAHDGPNTILEQARAAAAKARGQS